MITKTDFSLAFLKFLLPLSATVLFLVTWYVSYSAIIPMPFYRKGNWFVIFLYFVFYYLIAAKFEVFRVEKTRLSDIIYSIVFTSIITNVIMYAVICLIGRFWMPVLGILLLTIGEIILGLLWGVWCCRYYRKNNPPASALLICDGDRKPERLAGMLRARFIQFKISAVKSKSEIKSDFSELLPYGVVVVWVKEGNFCNAVTEYCYKNKKKVFLYPNIADVLINGADMLNLTEEPFLCCNNDGIAAEARIIKRFFDVVLSLAGLALTSPLMLAIAMLIKTDGGPAIYTQQRLTIGGKPFKLYKFRTMKVDAEADGVARLSSIDDERVTKVGRALRKTRLDEIPQLYNVLKGDLTLIGPRPERPELIEEYTKEFPEFNLRLRVKAGLTGYAQVMGKYSTTPETKLLLDLIYIENFSYMLDIKIFIRTIKICFTSTSSY